MFKYIKLSALFFPFLFIAVFNSCDNSSTEQETFYEANDRYSGNFALSASINKITAANQIGFMFLYGITDSTRIRYVIDRKAKAKTKELAESELKKIDLEHIINSDTLSCNVVYPPDLNNVYEANLSLDLYYKKDILVRKPNQGVYAAYFNSDLNIETEAWGTTVENHEGSIEVRSTDGNITANLIIPGNGFCKCYSINGNLHIRIPRNISASVNLKTATGTITYTNLDLSVEINTARELKGTSGSGDAEIFLESHSGNIILEGF